MQSVRVIAGLVFLLAATCGAGEALYLIGRVAIGGPLSWLFPATFVASLLFLVGGILSWIRSVVKGGTLGLTTSLMLGAWWLPAFFYTVYIYFSPSPPRSDPRELLWAFATILLSLGSLAAGVAIFTHPSTRDREPRNQRPAA
jgi:heme/copper-type cytochrome/quinol oxidase subunit 1